MRTRFLWLSLGFLLIGSALAVAQNCRGVKVNTQNAKQCQTISTTAVTVATANTSRCSLLIVNNSTNTMNCTDVDKDGAPTATLGMAVPPGQGLGLNLEGQGRWQCIRSGASDAIACVAEGLP